MAQSKFRGDRMRVLRKEKKLMANHFANSICVSRATLYRYEKGEVEPPKYVVEKMAELLQVSVDYLMDNTETPSYNTTKSLIEKLADERSLNARDLERLISTFQLLNNHGRQEAIARMQEMSELYKYHAKIDKSTRF